jgi:2-dehydropantoate 2-reductase
VTTGKSKIKIVVAGIGGVGGFFGGLLAKTFYGHDEVEIYFLARGEHLNRIKSDGLKVITNDKEFIAHPKMATGNASEIGIADYILVCTKSYDLEKIILQVKPIVGAQTVIISFLNGVDSPEKIKSLLPGHLVAGGSVYIISSIKSPGLIQNSGNIQKLFFGLDNSTDNRLVMLDKFLKKANIEATLTENISSVMWEKFHLVGANSTATSFYKNTTGEILADRTKENFLLSLLKEVNQIALAKGIKFDAEMVLATMDKLRALPFDTTSSMQRDFQKQNGKTELETITGYIVRAGKQLKVPTPAFETAYNKLKPLAQIALSE